MKTEKKRQYPFEGIGWYLVLGLESFGSTAEDFVGPFESWEAARSKWLTYSNNDDWEIYWIGSDGFAYVDGPDDQEKVS